MTLRKPTSPGPSVVLITGAAGSIGSELAMRVASLNPAAMHLLDINETRFKKFCNRTLHCVLSCLLALLRVKLDDQLFVNFRRQIATFWNALESTFHFRAVDFNPCRLLALSCHF